MGGRKHALRGDLCEWGGWGGVNALSEAICVGGGMGRRKRALRGDLCEWGGWGSVNAL